MASIRRITSDFMNKVKLFLIIIFSGSLIGCGFSPANKIGSSSQLFLEEIEFAEPKSDLDFVFLSAVERKMQNRNDFNYLVSYTVNVSENTETENIINLTGTVKFTVVKKIDMGVIFTGQTTSFFNYSDDNNYNRRSAISHLMEILADSVRLRLVSFATGI